MKEFEVRIVVSEYYTTYVFAEDEDQACEFANEKLGKGELEMNHIHSELEATETGYEED